MLVDIPFSIATSFGHRMRFIDLFPRACRWWLILVVSALGPACSAAPSNSYHNQRRGQDDAD
eukprot:6121839-Pyramimonas_sp.AAC.1